MLRFSDFSHLPEVDELVGRLIAEASGLTVVAGLESRPGGGDAGSAALPAFLPSGRGTIFRVLAGELMDAHPDARCLVVAEDRNALPMARRFRNRLDVAQVKSPQGYAEAIESGATTADMLVVDRLTRDSLAPALAAARAGKRVLTQLDTVFHAQAVAHYLTELLPDGETLDGLRWVLSVQRIPTLCPICKRPADVTADQLAQLDVLARRYAAFGAATGAAHAPSGGGAFFAPGACAECNGGRRGDVAVFDFLQVDGPPESLWARPSTLPMEAYIWMLAQRGQLALSDALEFDAQQLRRTYALLTGSERHLTDTTAALERATAQLDSANRLLNQRTRELVALEGIGQALITWSDLRELGGRVLKTAMELCKADRGILYYLRSAEWGQILAARGWDEAEDGAGLARNVIYENLSDREAQSYAGAPPGVAVRPDSPRLLAGHAIPLVAHGMPAGLMLIQSTRKRRFTPGETALLQTLAGYAAVAMQRAGLIEQLQSKIEALQAAQVELAQKERLESELELARRVQLSMLPQKFPQVPGVRFGAAYVPARQVGGDFYDVIRLDEERIALVIADVADKGMAAALYMALARSLILAESRQHDEPRVVLEKVNQLLLELGERDMFVTVFYGVLHLSRNELVYSRAGHDHPYLLRDGRLIPLDGHGIVLGLFEPGIFELSQETLAVRRGDKLVLYTDGLADVVEPGGEMLGAERLAALIGERAADPPEALCSGLLDDLAALRRGEAQFDDMALLVVGIE